MRYSLLAYNKDRDIYEGIIDSDNKAEIEEIAKRLVYKIHDNLLVDETGEPFDWLELWDEENGKRDTIYH